MGQPLDDERLQFFLRHRDEIREWAAIEREVVVATREILASVQDHLDERLATVDSGATTARRDGGKYERIVALRAGWPDGVGVSLEWDSGVDPFGSWLPKFGILFLNEDPVLQAARLRVASLAASTPALTAAGFKVPGDRNWPGVRWVPKSKDWWKDVDAWTSSIVESLVDLWPIAAPLIDQALDESTPPPARTEAA